MLSCRCTSRLRQMVEASANTDVASKDNLDGFDRDVKETLSVKQRLH